VHCSKIAYAADILTETSQDEHSTHPRSVQDPAIFPYEADGSRLGETGTMYVGYSGRAGLRGVENRGMRPSGAGSPGISTPLVPYRMLLKPKFFGQDQGRLQSL
jgi:hypothetical protein